jgi:RHS repeat-associated protein
MTMLNRSSVSSADQRYKFTGKERDSETGYDYFGARYGVYPAESGNSWLGRWLQVDPLAGKFPGLSPYNYTLNNPVKNIDPNGLYSYQINGIDVDPSLFGQLSPVVKDDNRNRTLQEPQDNGGDGQNKDPHKLTPGDLFSRLFLPGLERLGNAVRNAKTGINDFLYGAYNVVYGQGPQFLNDVSEKASLEGVILSAGALSSGQAEIGVPLITFAGGLSLSLDGTATTMAVFDYWINGGTDRYNKAMYQAGFSQSNILI